MHQELQDQDLLGSTHLEERWIGGNVDLDLLSQIPQRYARIMGGNERGASFPRSTMEEREGEKSCLYSLWGRRGLFIGPTKKSRCRKTSHRSFRSLGPETPAYWDRKLRPPPGAEHCQHRQGLGKLSGALGRKVRPGAETPASRAGNSAPHQGLNSFKAETLSPETPVLGTGNSGLRKRLLQN